MRFYQLALQFQLRRGVSVVVQFGKNGSYQGMAFGRAVSSEPIGATIKKLRPSGVAPVGALVESGTEMAGLKPLP